MNRYFILFLIFIANCFTGFSQTGNSVSGKVVRPGKKSIPFANVALYSSTDSTIVKGAMSNENGEFLLEEIAKGNYYLKIYFIGFKTTELSEINIGSSDIRLDEIVLRRTRTKIEEITVVSEKGMFESQAGKMVYNVDGNVNSVGESANELLMNIPSVGINMDEKVTVRGSRATVLIDGVESGLSEMLDQIPAGAIESIEVMTNPSVRYDAKGGGSIVNIKLKKQAGKGYNGKLEAGIGTREKRNANGLVGFNLNNWRVSALANYQHQKKETFQKSTRTILKENENAILYQERIEEVFPTSIFSNITGTYYSKDKSFLSLKYTLQRKKQDRFTQTFSEGFKDDILNSVSEINRTGSSKNLYNQFSIRFRKNQKDNKGKLEGNALYSFNAPETEYDQIVQPFQIEGGQASRNYKTDIKIYENEVRLFKMNLDYSGMLFTKITFETGVQLSHNNYKQNLTNTKINQTFNNESGIWTGTQNVLYKNFTNRNSSASIYVLLSSRLGKYLFSGGLRGEYTKNITETDTTFSVPIYKLVPSVHLKKEVSEKYSWEVSLTARSKPPKYTQLNPISLTWGSYTKSSGNPNLRPEFFYQTEWSNNWKWEKSHLNLSLYFKNQTDIIGKWYFIEVDDGREISHSKYENLGSLVSAGTDISGMLPLGKLIVRPSINLYLSKINGEKFASTLDRQEVSYSIKIGTNYPITERMKLQITGVYNSPFISVYGKQFEQFYLDAGISTKIFKNKGSLVLKVIDVFNSMEYDKIINQRINYLKESHIETKSFLVYLNFAYKFNSFKKVGNKSKK